MTTDNNCIFCKIVNGEIVSKKIWENAEFVAFADIKPVGEGHTLVIPKKHFQTLIHLDEETSSKYINAIRKTGEKLMEKYGAEGFNIVLNNGEAAGQIVQHIHFHLLPRKTGDKKRGIFIG